MIPQKNNQSWKKFLDPNHFQQLKEIEQQINQQKINPDLDKVLRFLELDLNQIKVVILGQDPYPEPGVATGRAFQVAGLDSWQKPFRQSSLRNILRLIYKNYQKIEKYQDISTFNQIKTEIKNGDFEIENPYDLIESWEKQGVLLLNTSFSCLQNQPNSHRELWLEFSHDLIQFIAQSQPEIKWFLWGKSAQKFAPLIASENIYASRHPMMCSDKFADDFLKNNCFKDTMDIIDWRGQK